jgi:hypothetical protein
METCLLVELSAKGVLHTYALQEVKYHLYVKLPLIDPDAHIGFFKRTFQWLLRGTCKRVELI